MNLGNAIKTQRELKELSPLQLAELAGCTQVSIHYIEKNTNIPRAKSLRKICLALEISEARLYLLALEKSDFKKDREYQPLLDQLIKFTRSKPKTK